MFGDQEVGGGFDMQVSEDVITSGLTTSTGRLSDIELARGEDQESRRGTRSSLRASVSTVDDHEVNKEINEMDMPTSAMKPMRGFQEVDEIPAFEEQQVQCNRLYLVFLYCFLYFFEGHIWRRLGRLQTFDWTRFIVVFPSR